MDPAQVDLPENMEVNKELPNHRATVSSQSFHLRSADTTGRQRVKQLPSEKAMARACKSMGLGPRTEKLKGRPCHRPGESVSLSLSVPELYVETERPGTWQSQTRF